HPSRPTSDANTFRLGQQPFRVHQLSRDYPWESVFAPQDVELAQRHLRLEVLDMERDLRIPNFEGAIAYVRPVFDDAQISRRLFDNIDSHAIEISTPPKGPIVLRQKHDYGGYRWMNKVGLSPSSRAAAAFSVFRDGLLVPDAAAPTRDPRFLRIGLHWPLPLLRINLPRSVGGTPDVSRPSFLGIAP